MVFESVVVDVLNRFLGDYVVNLDSSQLSLGIWGGKCARCQNQVFTLLKRTARVRIEFTASLTTLIANVNKISTLHCTLFDIECRSEHVMMDSS